MCFKKRNQPARLQKKEENKIKLIKPLLYNPNTWIIIIGIILLICAIWFAYKESMSFFYYNTGMEAL